MRLRLNSLIWKLVLPVPIILAAAMGLAWYAVPAGILDNAKTAAVDSAMQTAAQFKTIRGYYTANVVGKVIAGGTMKASENHNGDPTAIPLPATMMHDLSGLLRENDVSINLFSAFPFPGRADRVLDEFQQQAWETLSANPDQLVRGEAVREGKRVVRVAVADTMSAEACVNCHNSRADSPKTDWKLGDVRGVLEIDTVIENQIAAAGGLSNQILVGLGIAGLALLAAAIIGAQTVARPLLRMKAAMASLAEGHADVEVPSTSRRDEIGDMARAVQVFRDTEVRVRSLSEQEAARITSTENERSAMMQALRQAFGTVVDAAIDGDFTRRVDTEFTDPELNALASSINTLVASVDDGLTETAEVLSALAEADLTKRMTGQHCGAFARLSNDINATAIKLSDVIGELQHTSHSLKSATGEILAGANDLAERTSRQAATIQETSEAMQRLSGTVLDNARRAETAQQTANDTQGAAERSGEVMTSATEAMTRITASSSKISEIIGMIDDIAFQTNLLALNASVEAARAGEAGKGFAVVAIEVRRLAQSAAEASSDVKKLIEQSATEVASGSRLVEAVADALTGIVTSVRSMTGMMDEIATESRSQASSIKDVNDAVRQMDEMTQHNAALVEETNAAIEQTEAQANELDRIVDVFTLEADGRTAARPRTRAA